MKPQVPIEVDEETGVWTTDGLPMLYVPRHFFMNHHRAINQALGEADYASLLYDSGHLSAYQWCAYQGKRQQLSGMAVFEHYLRRLSQRGWGRFSFVRAGLDEFLIRVDHSAFVLQQRADNQPMQNERGTLCAMFAGWFSGAAAWVAERQEQGGQQEQQGGQQEQSGQEQQGGQQEQSGQEQQGGQQEQSGQEQQGGQQEQSGQEQQGGQEQQSGQEQQGGQEQSGQEQQSGQQEQGGQQQQSGQEQRSGQQQQGGQEQQGGQQQRSGQEEQSRQEQGGKDHNGKGRQSKPYLSTEKTCAIEGEADHCLFSGGSQPSAEFKMSYEHLFQPITLNKLRIKNRVVSTAHAEVYAIDGKPQERYIRYYEEKAKGGLGLAVCGGSSPVSRDSPWPWWQSVDLAMDEVIPHLANLAEAMHKHGCKIMIQATHMGRRSTYFGHDWPHLVTPSGIREPVHRGYAKIIEPYEIKRIIQDYATAVHRVQQSGMDGVEISAAHQHLIDQFWSPRVNKRTDEYGGSLENRMRFGRQVFEAIREKVGKDFCVGIRVSADEFHEDGLTHSDLKEIAQAMSETGLVDFISVIGSGADTHNTLANCMPPMALPPAPFLHLAAGIKSVVKLPVMHAQGIKDPQQAEKILAEGLVDMVGMTRAQIADPYFVEKVRSGRELQIKQCVGANYCIDRQYMGMDVLCVQNAATGRELTMPHIIQRSAARKKKVVVVGAGPAGLEAARVSAARGHQVVLFEKNEEIGGQINLAAKAPQRDQMAGIVRWFGLEIKRLNVQLRSNETADANKLKAEGADLIILATGGTPDVHHQQWGYDEGICVSSWDIWEGRASPGKNVLIYDSPAQHAGAGIADFMATKGSQVELVTAEIRASDDVGGTTFPIFYRRFYAQDIILTPNFWLVKVQRENERIIATLKNEYTDALEEREVDQVVIENGVKPEETLYYALKDESINQGEVDIDALYDSRPQPCLEKQKEGDLVLFRIGDCVSMHNIHGAIYDALRLCSHF